MGDNANAVSPIFFQKLSLIQQLVELFSSLVLIFDSKRGHLISALKHLGNIPRHFHGNASLDLVSLAVQENIFILLLGTGERELDRNGFYLLGIYLFGIGGFGLSHNFLL